MTAKMSELINKMTPQEQTEVEIFAAFVLTRRKMQKVDLRLNDISSPELLNLVAHSGSFDWLNQDKEDVYSLEDGEEVQWPEAL